MDALPIIDVSGLVRHDDPAEVPAQIGAACRDTGFFYVTGHDVPDDLLHRLDTLSRAFFRLPLAEKMEIAMARGGACLARLLSDRR
jgi:isopenicillin N synthase-like dioxygenase